MAVWDNLPKVFASLMPLASMPIGATFNMVFKNQSLDEAASEEASKALGGIDGADDFAYYSDENAIDKAMYQLTNPNALMTPWGPTLDDANIDMILMENPGLESMSDLSPAAREALVRDADDLIDNAGAGGWLNDFMDSAKDNAMALGLDVIETGKNMFDQSMTMLGDTMSKSLPAQVINSSLPSSGPEVGNIGRVGLGSPMINVSGTAVAGPSTDPVPSAIKKGTKRMSYANTVEVSDQAILNEHFNSSLYSDESDLEIFEDFVAGLREPDPEIGWKLPGIQNWIEVTPELKTERPELFNALTWAIDMKIETDESRMHPEDKVNWGDITDYTRPVDTGMPAWLVSDEGTEEADKAAPPPTPAQIAFERGGVESLAESEIVKALFVPKFYQAMSKVPNANHSAVQENMEALFDDAWINFAIWTAPSGAQNMTPEAFAQFLDRPGLTVGDYGDLEVDTARAAPREGYVWDPKRHTQGEMFYANIEKIKDALREESLDPGGAYSQGNSAILSVFGQNAGYRGSTGKYNRDRLAQLYATGFETGYIATGIHETVGTTMDYWRNMGVEEWDIFDRMTKTPYEKAVAATPYGERDYSIPQTPTAVPQAPMINMMDPQLTGGTRQSAMTAGQLPLAETVTGPGINMMDPQLTSGTRGPGLYAAAFPPQGREDLNQADLAAYEATTKPWRNFPVSAGMHDEALSQLEAARYDAEGERMPGGTGYKPYESTVAPAPDEKIPDETLRSMPEPFDDEQDARRKRGLPYLTGRWTGGTKAQFDRLSLRDKELIRSGDLWVSGTTFVPTAGYKREVSPTAAPITRSI